VRIAVRRNADRTLISRPPTRSPFGNFANRARALLAPPEGPFSAGSSSWQPCLAAAHALFCRAQDAPQSACSALVCDFRRQISVEGFNPTFSWAQEGLNPNPQWARPNGAATRGSSLQRRIRPVVVRPPQEQLPRVRAACSPHPERPPAICRSVDETGGWSSPPRRERCAWPRLPHGPEDAQKPSPAGSRRLEW